jgi:hypothetical protein
MVDKKKTNKTKRYWGKCNRCGSIRESSRQGWYSCKWGRCDGKVYIYREVPEKLEDANG